MLFLAGPGGCQNCYSARQACNMSTFNKESLFVGTSGEIESTVTVHFKNAKKCFLLFLEASGGQSYHLYLNVHLFKRQP
jgi:hypothetical protein